MRWSPVRRHDVQMGLFHPPRKSPEWKTLPVEAKQKVTRLVALMLRQHHSKRLAFEKAKEASDE